MFTRWGITFYFLYLLQNSSPETNSSSKRTGGYFCSDTVFNLSSRVLINTEINFLEKGLYFAPIQNKISEPELRKDFEGFSRRMRIKWYFRNYISHNFSEKSPFTPKSKWRKPKVSPSLKSSEGKKKNFLNWLNPLLITLTFSRRNGKPWGHFAPPYACVSMDLVEIEFLETQKHKPWVWFHYNDGVSFTWTYGNEKLSSFLEDLNKFHPKIKFSHGLNKKTFIFLDINVRLSDGKISTNLYVNISTVHRFIQFTPSVLQFLVRHWGLIGCAPKDLTSILEKMKS